MSTRILALDAATEACSVAVWNNGEIHAVYERCPREHTQRILPMVEHILAQSQLALSDFDALAFGRGPGSFTGVRIGIGIAQGLALGADLPMIGISTLNTLAQGAYRLTGCSHVLAAIDARMGEVYWGAYTRTESGEWQVCGEEQVLSPDRVNQQLRLLSGHWVTAGTGWETYPDMAANSALDLQQSGIALPHAEDMLPLALLRWQQGDIQSVEHSEPVYLRNEVTWKKLPGRE